MKTLIINGSPRPNGDTVSLLKEFKAHIVGEVVEVSAYRDKISPCIDCRRCWEEQGCVIKDDMDKIYADDFDTVVIASPVYMSNLTGPVLSLASRFQIYFAAARILKKPIERRAKKGILILVGGGDGGAEPAIESAKLIFKMMKATLDEDDVVLSLQTDKVPAKDDYKALEKVREVAVRVGVGEIGNAL